MSWREERRADRDAGARQHRADLDAAAQRRRDDLAAAAGRRQGVRDAAAHARARARQARARRLAQLGVWCGGHVIELLFAPVIVIPAVLSWTAMATYGQSLYGAPGWLMPAFSEGAMWVFAAATTVTRRRFPDRPVGMLVTGTWVFAAAAAALNFLHGLGVGTDLAARLSTGAVMAMVSIAGVLAHQIITASQRRTRHERAAAKLARAAAKRVELTQRLAVAHAPVQVGADGSAELVYRPGLVAVTRSWSGRRRLVPTMVPGLPPATAGTDDWLDVELAELLASGTTGNTPGTAQTSPAETSPQISPGTSSRVGGGDRDTHVAEALTLVRSAIAAGLLPGKPSRRRIRTFLRCRTETAQEVARALAEDDDGPGALAGSPNIR